MIHAVIATVLCLLYVGLLWRLFSPKSLPAGILVSIGIAGSVVDVLVGLITLERC